MDVQAYMAERIPLIDAEIDARLPADSTMPVELLGAMRHLLFPGGKRLRPILAMAAAQAVGGAERAALPMAVAVELVHTYSLIHDDLPCMDDDDERRGRPTVHKAFDEATAVLAGDALLTEAFAVLADDPGDGESTHDASDLGGRESGARLFAVQQLAKAAGALGLVGGQVDDLRFAATETSGAEDKTGFGVGSGTRNEWLASIHARKTAALFQAAIVGGAAFGGASASERTTLDAFARDVGIAFQIADDLLDASSEEAASILRLQGVDDAKAGAIGLLDRALDRIEGWGERAEALRALAGFAVRRDR